VTSDNGAVPDRLPSGVRRIVVMGVSGSGKSTVGVALAEAVGYQFVDGDSLHPAANVAKMTAGIALDDADRWPWLARVGQVLAGSPGIVVACSALKREYRDAIRSEAPDAFFVELDGSRTLLGERLGNRAGHFMPASLLDSQLATLEPLQSDEHGIRVGIDQPIDATVQEILHAFPQDSGLGVSGSSVSGLGASGSGASGSGAPGPGVPGSDAAGSGGS
jgi:carbohydrate kinase (thermoresistant glucokinase family)